MTINIDFKPIMNYVLEGHEEIKKTGKTELTARGRGITRACTTSELILFTLRKTKFASEYENVLIETRQENTKNVTWITIKIKTLQKKE